MHDLFAISNGYVMQQSYSCRKDTVKLAICICLTHHDLHNIDNRIYDYLRLFRYHFRLERAEIVSMGNGSTRNLSQTYSTETCAHFPTVPFKYFKCVFYAYCSIRPIEHNGDHIYSCPVTLLDCLGVWYELSLPQETSAVRPLQTLKFGNGWVIYFTHWTCDYLSTLR